MNDFCRAVPVNQGTILMATAKRDPYSPALFLEEFEASGVALSKNRGVHGKFGLPHQVFVGVGNGPEQDRLGQDETDPEKQ
jgi:hypothetical protein